jgi:predicted RNA-binding Zn-ribbon protein involved in translation (DUF1610 family)
MPCELRRRTIHPELYGKSNWLAEGSRMASDNFIVFFACPKCGVCYNALQERCQKAQPGLFSCENCKAVVNRWSVGYDYTGWQRYENAEPTAKRSGQIHRPGAATPQTERRPPLHHLRFPSQLVGDCGRRRPY